MKHRRDAVIRKLIDNLPWAFVLAGITMPIAFYFISGYVLDTEFDKYFRMGTFLPYAAFSTVLFTGNVMFILLDLRNGRLPSAWLVTLTYATFFFMLLLWGSSFLTIVNGFFPEFENSFTARRVGHALIGSGLAGDGLAAFTLIVGWRRGLLGRRIHPWIWTTHRARRTEGEE